MRRDSYDTNGNLFESGTDAAPGDGAGVPMVLVRAWDRALRMLSQRVNKPTFETHLRGLKPVAFAEETNERGLAIKRVCVGAASAFTRSWVEGRHAGLIREVLEEIFDTSVVLSFALLPKDGDTGAQGSLGTNERLARRVVPPATLDLPEQHHSERMRETPAPRAETGAGAQAPATASEGGANGDRGRLRAQAGMEATRNGNGVQGAAQPDAAPTPASARQAPQAPRLIPNPQSLTPAIPSSTPHPDAPEINPRYTFDRFVVGQTNRLAHGGAVAVAASPGTRYNPLFLYGPPGLGKTHLLHAIANSQMQKTGSHRPRIAYMSGEAFTAQYVTSLRQQKAEEFRRKLKAVDMLLVDDVQFIAGKEHTKEEFYHVFNALAQTGKQIVICSDRSPRDLTAMDERLQSRFESGLVADVAPPDLELRLAILQHKAESESTRVPDDVLLYMARLVQSNIRTLEGALVKLVAYASLMNAPVTTQMAEGILEKYFIAAGAGLAPLPATGGTWGHGGNGHGTGTATGHGRGYAAPVPKAVTMPDVPLRARAARPPAQPAPVAPPPAPVAAPIYPKATGDAPLTADLIRRVVARQFGVTDADMEGKSRDRNVIEARQVAMHLLRELTDMSLPGIGQLFGGRDHTTVIHACDRVQAQLDEGDAMRTLVQGLVDALHGAGQ